MILKYVVFTLTLWAPKDATLTLLPAISDRYRLPPSPERTRLTLAYIRQHSDPQATSTRIRPVMVVIHWTATSTLASALATLRPEALSGRADIRSGGRLNVGTHFLVDRDGTVYRLQDETTLARHVIGLNRSALGIENVGSGSLTAEQLRADTALVADLKARYPIEYLIGHFESQRFMGSPLWEERQPGYLTHKSDPGAAFMRSLRSRLAARGIVLRTAP